MVCYDSIQQLVVVTSCLHAKLHTAGVSLPEVTIEYNNINVDADALLGSNSIPSLTNAYAAGNPGADLLTKALGVVLRSRDPLSLLTLS